MMRDADFKALRELALRAGITGNGVRPLSEPDQHEGEEGAPANEQQQHEPVHEHGHVIDFSGVGRCLNGHSQKVHH